MNVEMIEAVVTALAYRDYYKNVINKAPMRAELKKDGKPLSLNEWLAVIGDAR